MPDSDDSRNRMPDGPNDRRTSFIYAILAIALISYLIYGMRQGLTNKPQAKTISTNEFVTAVKEDRVEDVNYKASTGKVTGGYWDNAEFVGKKDHEHRYETYYVGSDSLQELMARHPKIKFTIDTTDGSILEMIVTTLLPTLIVVGALLYFMNQMQGQNGRAMNFGRTKAQTSEETRPKVKFTDVVGIDEAVEELQEVRDFLAEPERYHKMGASSPSVARTSSRCSWAWARAACATSSNRPRMRRRQSSSSTRSTPWDVSVVLASAEATTSASRR